MDRQTLPARKIGVWTLALAFVVLGPGRTPAQSSKGAQDKVDRFLELILKASSLDQVGRAFERASFSAAEVKRIETEVRKAAYRNRLEGLKPKLPLIRLNELTVSKQAPSARTNDPGRTTSSSLPRVKSASAKPPNAPAISKREIRAVTSRPGGGTDARISRVEPASLQAGQTLAISGSGFGRARGSVEILLDGRRYVCDLGPWGDSAIQAVVPEYMESVIGARARGAVLWVKLAGLSLGPTFDVRLAPALALASSAPKAAAIVEKEISTYVELDGSTSIGETDSIEILLGQRLANGWRIVRSRLERASGSGSFEYIVEPRAGTSELHQVIRLTTRAFSRLRVASRMVIRGPQGTDYL